MKLVNFRRLKSAVGHDYVNENEVQIEVIYQHQLIKIIFTLNKIWTWQQICCWNNWLRAALLEHGVTGDGLALRRYENDPGDRDAVPGHQGGAVVPDKMTSHEEIRPVTHWLVRTEVSRLIRVG
jgi:hypothetical protein